MNGTLRSIAIGIVAGATAMLVMWLMRSPHPQMLQEVIRLDTLDAAARRPGVSSAELLEQRAQLERTVRSFVVNELSLGQVLVKLADDARVNIVVVWGRLAHYNPPLGPDLPVSVVLYDKTVDRVLRSIFEPLNRRYEHSEPNGVVTWFVLDGIIYISDRKDLSDAAAPLRVYDVRDLMLTAAPFAATFPATTRPAEADYGAVVMQGSEKDIADRLITALTGGFVGSDGEVRSVHYFAGRLLIRATPQAHVDIEQRLQLVRKTR